MTAPNPCKLQHFLHFSNRFFALMNAKNAGIYAFPKKSKIVTYLWAVYVQFLNARCFHMFFALFCILPEETTLQIETGRQRDPKENWREETHRSFYPHTHRGFYTEKFLRKGYFYIQKVLHREIFTLRSFFRQRSRSFYITEFFTRRNLYTDGFLHTDAFAHRSFYTEKPWHRGAFTYKSVYTQQAFAHSQGLLHREAFTQRTFLHTEGFTQRSLSFKELLHTNVLEFLHTKVVTQKSLYTESF